MCDLNSIEWHDLPVGSLSIKEYSIELVLLSFDEETSNYVSHKLTLRNFESVHINIQGTLTSQELQGLEINRFEYSIQEELLNGSIGIFPGSGGYWSVVFSKAEWDFMEVA